MAPQDAMKTCECCGKPATHFGRVWDGGIGEWLFHSEVAYLCPECVAHGCILEFTGQGEVVGLIEDDAMVEVPGCVYSDQAEKR